MACLRYTFRSVTLAMDVNVTILVPANYNYKNRKPYVPGMRFQTLYLLHGGGEDDLAWLRRTRIEEYAEQNELLVVCPATHKGMFMNTAYGANYEDFLTKELPEVVKCFFPGALTPEDTFIAGQGLGAGGALSIALKHPEDYAFCAALTPGIGAELDREMLLQQIDRIPLFGGTYSKDEAFLDKNDLLKAAKHAIEAGLRLPGFYVSVSEGDTPEIVETVKRQVRILISLGIEVPFEITGGHGHDREYCDREIRKVIEEYLPLKHTPLYP